MARSTPNLISSILTLFALPLMYCAILLKTISSKGIRGSSNFVLSVLAPRALIANYFTLRLKLHRKLFYSAVTVGCEAPDPVVLAVDRASLTPTAERALLSYAKPGRPLVMNFGSYT